MKKTRMEDGFSPINYATYFFVIMIVVLLYSYLTFNASLLVVEEELEQGLHIAENAAIVANGMHPGMGPLEKELYKKHIITKADNTTSDKKSEESDQVKFVANELSQNLIMLWNMEGAGNRPQNNTIADLTKNGNVYIDSAVIYEPVYKMNVTPSEANENIPFDITYDITHYVVYRITYDACNQFLSFTKDVCLAGSAPTLTNGNTLEGATLEATVRLKLYGLKNIMAQGGNKIFSNSPVLQEFSGSDGNGLRVTQAVDIVLTNKDSRKK